MDKNRIDYSDVTPATGTNPYNKPLADTLANEMPISDMPTWDTSLRAAPDKIIPGHEAASGVDGTVEEHVQCGRGQC